MSDNEAMSEVALSHLRKWNTGEETVSWASLGTSQGNHVESAAGALPPAGQLDPQRKAQARSEERRVGKECRSRWSP